MTTSAADAQESTNQLLSITYTGKHGEHQLVIDCSENYVSMDGSKRVLTHTEQALLLYLVRHRPRLIARGELMAHLYANTTEPEPKIIDVYLSKIRKNLDLQMGQLISTIWGRGYQFSVDTTSPIKKNPSMTRPWTYGRKLKIVLDVTTRSTSREQSIADVAGAHHIPPDELRLWIDAYHEHGDKGLQAPALSAFAKQRRHQAV